MVGQRWAGPTFVNHVLVTLSRDDDELLRKGESGADDVGEGPVVLAKPKEPQ